RPDTASTSISPDTDPSATEPLRYVAVTVPDTVFTDVSAARPAANTDALTVCTLTGVRGGTVSATAAAVNDDRKSGLATSCSMTTTPSSTEIVIGSPRKHSAS